MGRIKTVGTLLFVLYITTPLAAQTVIKGSVSNGKTGTPLYGANVYLANTTIGNSANKKGHYRIGTKLEGKFTLVFSFVGYQTKTVSLILDGKGVLVINARLSPKAVKLKELSVTASNVLWQKHFALFKQEFIGQTRFAEKTFIKNPFVLRFDINEKGNLIAYSPKPLSVVNRALGYHIYIELKKFQFTLNGEKGFYLIYSKYEPLKPSSKEQKERRQENRRAAYLGSLRQFLKRLYHDEVRGLFSVNPRTNIRPLSKFDKAYRLLGKAPTNVIEGLKGFKLLGPTVITYGRFSDKRRSAIGSNTEDHIFFINQFGNLWNPLSLRTGGYWDILRVANTLPLNYQVER